MVNAGQLNERELGRSIVDKRCANAYLICISCATIVIVQIET